MSRNLRLSSEIELAALLRWQRSNRSDMREAEAAHRVQQGSSVPATAPTNVRARPKADAAHEADAAIRAPDPFVVLPWPPTGNHTVKHVNGAHYLTSAAKNYRRTVAEACLGCTRIAGQYRLNVHFSPPDRRARDMDNALKSLLDALVPTGFLPSDSMTFMRELHATVDDFKRGTVGVHVEPIIAPEAA